MADPQQVLYGDDGKPIPSTALYDDNGKPISVQPAQDTGTSHGWLLDNLWNAGKRIEDIGSGLLNASPMGQMSQASDMYNKLQQNPHALDSQMESFKQQLGNVTVPQYASALAMNVDPTGIVPGEVGLAKQIPSDISQQNYGGALANTVLGALPFLHAFLGPDAKASVQDPYGTVSPGTEMKYARMPDLVNSIPESAKQVTQQGLLNPAPTASPMRQLPAYGETSTQPRFYAGPAGMADARMAYPYDINDISRPSPQTVSSGEPGVQAPNDIGPIQAANRSIINQVPDKAQLNDAFRALVPDRYAAQPTTQPIGIQGVPKEPDVVQAYREGGQIINPPKESAPFGSNQVDVTNQALSAHTPEGIAAIADSDPSTVGHRPIPDVLNSTPVNPSIPEDLTTPRSGQSRPTDTPNNLFTYTDSTNKILSRYDSTAQIPQLLNAAQDAKLPFINEQLNKLEPAMGVNDFQNKQIFNILDGKLDPTTVDPDTANKAAIWRSVANDIHQSLPPGVGPKGNDVGYISDYITHMRDSSPANASIFDYFLKKARPAGNEIQPQVDNPNAVGTGVSPITKTRTGALKNYSTDLPSVTRAFVNMSGKAKFDTPAVTAAKEIMNNIPQTQPRLQSLANAYIRNYNQYDGEGQLMNEMRGWTNAVANTTAQSALALNPRFHALHIGEIPATVFPELGPRYTGVGMKNLAMAPTDTFKELAHNGLLPDRVIPWTFKTPMERLNMATNYFDAAEAITKGIAYNGAKQRALDMGMSPQQAVMKAIYDTKDMTLTSDPSRVSRALMAEGPVSQVVTRLGGQFKGVPLKLIEQYTDIAANFKNNPGKAARALFGGGLAIGGTVAGLHTFHIPGASLLSPTVLGPFGDAMKQVTQDLAKGDVAGALGNTLAWAMPGGQTIKSILMAK